MTSCEYVVGKPIFTVPQLGYLAAYIQEPPGTYIAISAAAGMMLVVLLLDTFTEDKEAAARKEAEKKARKAAKKNKRKEDVVNPIDESAESLSEDVQK